MLVSMVMVAAFFSFVNYAMTKWGLDRKPNFWSVLRRIVLGAAVGFMIWLSTMSGDLVTHERGLWMSAIFGFFSEKTLFISMHKLKMKTALLRGPKVPLDDDPPVGDFAGGDDEDAL